jgi:hypothetical protein
MPSADVCLHAVCPCAVEAWVHAMEDLSGLEPSDKAWFSVSTLPMSAKHIFSEIGRVYVTCKRYCCSLICLPIYSRASCSVSRYVPFLLANAAAFTRDGQPLQKPVMHAVIVGQSWVAPAFPYQVKCLHALRQQYHGLGAADREAVDSALSGTGCLDLFVMPSKL